MWKFANAFSNMVGILAGLVITSVICILFIFAPNIGSSVIYMCLIASITTATGLFTNSISSAFVRYGKNATAAGIANAAVSLGFIAPLGAMILQENTDWQTVRIAIAIAAILSVVIALAVLPVYTRFKRKEEEEDRLEEARRAASANSDNAE